MTSLQTSQPTTRPQGMPEPAPQVRDAEGYEIFCTGDQGAAHVMAHRMLDSGRLEEGYRRLKAWLRDREGSGSEWVHLQWHMAIFELAVGQWDSAFARYLEWIQPAAAYSEQALTDGPALLWKLRLSAPEGRELPWAAVRARALTSMRSPATPWVKLHHFLALAGAGDLEAMDLWLERLWRRRPAGKELTVAQVGTALRALVMGDHQAAALTLGVLQARIRKLGGSKAQRQLFDEIARDSASRALEIEEGGRSQAA